VAFSIFLAIIVIAATTTPAIFNHTLEYMKGYSYICIKLTQNARLSPIIFTL